MEIKDILVPVDFSPSSLRAIEFARSLVEKDGEVYLLHVIDIDFVQRLTDEGFSEPEAATARIRGRAEGLLVEMVDEILKRIPESEPKLETMVVVGKPFAEILRVAADLDFQMIVLATHSRERGHLEELLFGSTAEKVLRGSRVPVIFVPAAD